VSVRCHARPGLALAALAAVVLLGAPAAHGRAFGADLRRPANATAGCQTFIFYYQVFSCSWTTSGAPFNTSEGMVVPGTGTITRVRIKVGPQTGPMRIATLQALRAQNGGEAACCVGRRQTGVFTPRPNAITTLRVNIPVSVTYNSHSGYYVYDILFLTMEDATTPIPANASDPNTDNCSGGWFPAVRPHQENYGGPYGVCGYTILIRADWRARRH
jgi:hypothetical protein